MNVCGFIEKELKTQSITTGSGSLDKALSSGIRLGTITEIVGSSGVGKTQLCIQLMFNTILPKPLGAIDGEAIFISTRPGNFSPDRILPMADHHVKTFNNSKSIQKMSKKVLTTKELLDRIYFKQVTTTKFLIKTVHELVELIEKFKRDVRLIIIDSYSVMLRGLASLEQIRIDYELLDVLQQIANLRECAVVLTNNVSPVITGGFGDSITQLKPSLGNFHHHRIQQRLLMTKNKSEILACVHKSVSGKCSIDVKLKITETGVTDADKVLNTNY